MPLPACTPSLRRIGVFALSLTAGETFGRLATFLWFGVGFGLPLLALSLLSGAAQRWITHQFALHARLINLAGGVLLVLIGAYDLWSNRDLIGLYLFTV
jgi:cytochrome c-type biogenesis protein